MSTVAFFHAHPDDESMLTAGTMALLSKQGHRVVLVTATDGALGEIVPGVLSEGETLAHRRREELEASCELLGVARLFLLGYKDSGMAGTAGNEDPSSFAQADVDEASERLAEILAQEHVDVLSIYDDHGGYGHPDHIKVHEVGLCAAQSVNLNSVFLATINRDTARSLFQQSEAVPAEERARFAAMLETIGMSEAELSCAVDISTALDQKRGSMLVHKSQIAPDAWPLALSDEDFGRLLGTEWYAEVGAAPGPPFRASLVSS